VVRSRLTALIITAFALAACPARAATTASGTITAHVESAIAVSFNVSDFNFPNANPADVPSVPPTEGGITIAVKARGPLSMPVTLTVQANDDLRSGANVIPIDKITWTVTGSGFAPGTMSKAAAQSMGSWSGPGEHSGTFAFRFENSFDYEPGVYSATVTYTVTGP